MRKGKSREGVCLPNHSLLRGFRRRLLAWYVKNGRHFPWRNRSATKYQLIIAEILLQRTRAETIATFFGEFLRAFPSWKKLSDANEEDIARFLRPIGLWRRRASSLKLLAVEMARRNGRFPRNREEIEALPGVGQYIANAVLLFCHDEPQPLLDVNMARVLERVFGPRQLADIRYDPYLQSLSSTVVNCRNPREINWAILDLAATTCRDSAPRCHECPLRRICLYQGGP